VATLVLTATPVPGDRVSTVISLGGATPSCVWGRVAEHTSAPGSGGSTYPIWYIALLPQAPSALDPTHRGFVSDGYETSSIPGEVPINGCAGT